MDTSAEPVYAEGILCRANDIETYDTAMLRMGAEGATLEFLATHAGASRIDPCMRFAFENAVVEMTETDGETAICATFRDGTVKRYGAVRPDFFNKIPYCCDVVRGLEAPICTVETATPHLKTVDAVTEGIPVVTLTGSKNEKDVTVVEGLAEILEQSFRENKMPWELTDRFGVPTKVLLTDYEWRGTL